MVGTGDPTHRGAQHRGFSMGKPTGIFTDPWEPIINSFIFRGYKVITHNLVFKTFIFPLLGSMGTWTVDIYGKCR